MVLQACSAGRERPALCAFSSTGTRAASARTRLHAWVTRLSVDWQWFAYLGASSYSVRDVARRLPSVLRAETELAKEISKGIPRAFIHREVSPISGGLQEQALRRHSDFMVFDLDDAIYTPGKSILTRVRVEKFSRIAAMSDVVIAANEHLADWATDFSSHVRLIPTCIEPNEYILAANEIELAWYRRRVVWLGSPSSEPYLRVVSEPLSRFLRESNTRLCVISSGARDLGPLQPFVDRVEWRPGVEKTLGAYLLGIGPLPLTEFTIGKSAYKLIQYAAAGLPFVASPIGANGPVASSLGGSLAHSDGDWYAAFWTLASLSADERFKFGQVLAERARGLYSYEVWMSRWIDAVGLF